MKKECLDVILQAIINGDAEEAKTATLKALETGIDPNTILSNGLLIGADVVGKNFESGKFYLPELMMTGMAMKSAMAILEPALKEKYLIEKNEQGRPGTIVIATVQTDIHDIGKNIVSCMFTAAGFEVHDLGVDVQLKTIIANAKEFNADIIACSALLTTSLPYMRDLVNLLEAMREREHFILMMGGAAVTQDFVKSIHADCYERNPISAVQIGKKLIEKKRWGKEL